MPFSSFGLYLFIYFEDSNFSWANAGAAVFSTSVATFRNEDEDEEGSDEDVSNDDIHFEPIISLPEVC